MNRPDDIASSGPGRLYRGQTAIDFYGARRFGLIAAVVIVVVTTLSLLTQGLNLGLDFEGGQAWDVPATNGFDPEAAEDVLQDNGVSIAGSKIQERASETTSLVTVQITEVSQQAADRLTEAFAEASGSTTDEVSFSFTSSSWGRDITEKAVRALVIFLAVVAVFISIRFEWRMAVAALAAMAHDVLFTVGVYTVFRFEVTPATVIAFLTILGYSLYDTIVVFDRVQENEGRYAGVKMPYPDIVNISMNQVMMRSINTSVSSVIPVVSLLLVGAGILGAQTLREFALALFVGMVSGVYSSIFVAAPLLATLRASTGRPSRRERLTGEELRGAVVGAGVTGRVQTERPPADEDRRGDAEGGGAEGGELVEPGGAPTIHQPVERILSHPPRPRKKKRR
ncbi:protein translocase subunit SecF [Ilumatobacter sp.]|uniref:protein translocase subunit SecF n=1 Tax=Ilumatobacter sp. TaxID=1967498 RepID=UPI003B51E1CD